MSNDKLHGLRFEARKGNDWYLVGGRAGRMLPAIIYDLTEPQARPLAAMLNSAPAMLEALRILNERLRGGVSPDDLEAIETVIAAATGEPK